MIPLSPSGVPYLPDGVIGSPEPPRPPRALWLTVVFFLGTFALLQWGWSASRGTWVERMVVNEATVRPAAGLVRLITPDIPAKAVAASIKAPGGGLNILNGCEGTEVMFLLTAAFAAVGMPWRRRTGSLAAGLALIYIANQARILALFYAYRADRALFDMLHTAVLPVVLVALAAGYFYAALHYSQRRLA